ncbi:MAG: siphovirus ReqiPepy6 Gp37-like family protein, partial [Oscillospiraceae bacterium]|nr:siphovirus ReqiPepy6 Gp37-like family protein [Oscillospiraceae bacterium]
MILYVWEFDGEKYKKSAVIDDATSVIWVRRFQTAGEFEIYIRATKELFTLFTQEELLITRHDIPESAMIPERTELTTDAENGDYLIISGRSAESILGRRVILGLTTYSGTVEGCIRYLVTRNLIAMTSSNPRAIKLLELAKEHNYPEKINKQVTGKNLLETISNICIAYQYGLKLSFTGEKFIMDIYKGIDRSLHQSENQRVIFSPEFENIGNTNYIYDRSTYYNSATVAGEGEGRDRRVYTMYQDREHAKGLFLHEKWIDARNISSNTDDGEMTYEQYRDIMYQQAQEELEQSKPTKEFNGKILDNGMYQFGIDYGLGDVVSVVNQCISGT